VLVQYWSWFIAAFVQSVAQAAPYVVIGFIIAALLREFMSMAYLQRAFSARGLRGLFLATGVGALLPLCSCTVIPVGVGLVKSGAARGTVMSFLTSAPAVSPVAIILSLSLLGPKLTAIYVLSVMLGAALIGAVANRLLAANDAQYHEQSRGQSASATVPGIKRVGRALRWAFWDLGTDISVDLIIGLSIAAAILSFLPMGWIATWLGQQDFWTLLYVIVIGIPVYTCSIPSLPVVQSLLVAGMSPGAAIAYLIAGPATNLGELLVLRRQLGARFMWIFIAGLALLSLTAGLITDKIFFPHYDYQPATAASQAPIGTCCVASMMPNAQRVSGFIEAAALIPLWHWPFAVVLLITLVTGVARRIIKRFAKSEVSA
jgi:uncharacterized protein